MPARPGQPLQSSLPPTSPQFAGPSRLSRPPQPSPNRFAHLQEVYDEKSALEDTHKSPNGLPPDMSPISIPSSHLRSHTASPVSAIPPWIRSQRPHHQHRPSYPHQPFSPAPCPIASSWANSSPYSYSSPISPTYTLPRCLRIANLIKPWIPIILYIITSLSVVVAVSFWKVEVFQGLDELSRWLKSDTYLGYGVIFTLILVTTVPPVPLYSTLIILSGYTFGAWTGLVISYLASIVGAVVVFLLSRTFFRASLSRWLSCTVMIKRMVRAVENNPKLLFLIRLAPYPYNVMNCLLATSSTLTLRTYTLCTGLALPKLIIHTSIGSSIRSFASYHAKRPGSEETNESEDDGNMLSHYSTIVGIVMCIAIFIYLSYITRKAVDEELQDEDAMEAAYSEERIAFLAEDGHNLDVEEHMAETRPEVQHVPFRGNSATPVSFVVAEAAHAAAAAAHAQHRYADANLAV